MLFIVEYIAFYCWYVRYHSVVICHLPFGTQPFASCLNIIRVVRHRYWHIPYSLSLTHSCISLSLSLTRFYCYFAHFLIPIAIFFTYLCMSCWWQTYLHAPVFISQARSYFINAFSTVNQLHMNASMHNTVYIYVYLPCWPRKLTIFFSPSQFMPYISSSFEKFHTIENIDIIYAMHKHFDHIQTAHFVRFEVFEIH